MRRHMKLRFAAENFKMASETQKALLFTSFIHSEVRDHYWWRCIETECRHVQAERQKFRDNIHPDETLPKRYSKALRALELLLESHATFRADNLDELMPYVPGLQEHYKHERLSHRYILGITQRLASNDAEEALIKDPLGWCLLQLLSKHDNPQTFDHAMLSPCYKTIHLVIQLKKRGLMKSSINHFRTF